MDRSQWRHPVDWKLALLDKLASFFGDPDAGRVTILEMTETTPGHVKVILYPV